MRLGPYIYDIHEKCPVFAPPRPPRAPGRRNLGYQQPPFPLIPLGFLAKNCIGKSPKYTQCQAVIYNEKQHVKSINMSAVLIRLLQIVINCFQQESVYAFNLYFCSSVLVSQSTLIDVSIPCPSNSQLFKTKNQIKLTPVWNTVWTLITHILIIVVDIQFLWIPSLLQPFISV